jgi:hypothetical protein
MRGWEAAWGGESGGCGGVPGDAEAVVAEDAVLGGDFDRRGVLCGGGMDEEFGEVVFVDLLGDGVGGFWNG